MKRERKTAQDARNAYLAREWRGFSYLLKFVKREGHARVPKRHSEDGFSLGEWMGRQRGRRWRLPEERRLALESLPGWEWNPLEAAWNKGFEYLRRFVRREGHTRVPNRHVEDGFRLGNWVNAVRRSGAKGMTTERKRLLKSLPGWEWNTLEAAWNRGLEHLKRYVKREGHTRVPQRHKEDGFSLGEWVSDQRKHRSKMNAKRRRALEAVPGWMWERGGDGWEQGINHLRRFVEHEGHAKVPLRHSEDGYRLGAWVVRQRGGRERLPEARRHALESLPGWEWNPLEAAWNRGFEHLKHFVERNGHALVPARHVVDGFRLGNWVSKLRKGKGKGLTAERERLLESLPGWEWDPLDATWYRGFEHLQRYVEREGHAWVPYRHEEEGFKLGLWISKQRKRHASMKAERRRALEAIPGWMWERGEDSWERGFNHLRRFVEREGHARVLSQHVEDGFRLGAWVGRARQRAGKALTPERRRLLESLPGWEWNVFAEAWNRGFQHLRRYAEREGHAHVPQKHVEDGFKLGTWVSHQRQLRASMKADRRCTLEAIPGWMWSRGEESWERGFEYLKRFVEREGHSDVPNHHVEEGYSLGEWVRSQRRRRDKIGCKRRQALEELPGWLWSRRTHAI